MDLYLLTNLFLTERSKSMGKTIINGVKEDGMFDTEYKSTAILVTELIEDIEKDLRHAEIQHRLEDIRESAERDYRIRKMYYRQMQKKSNAKRPDERELIEAGVDAIKRCTDNHDMASVLTICKLCKAIAGDRFNVTVETHDD